MHNINLDEVIMRAARVLSRMGTDVTVESVDQVPQTATVYEVPKPLYEIGLRMPDGTRTKVRCDGTRKGLEQGIASAIAEAEALAA